MTKMMHFFTKLAAATLCLGYLAACAGPNPLEARLDPATQYPIKADSQLVTQPVLFPSGQITLSKEDKASLNAFVKHFYKSGGHMLEIRQTATTGDPQAEARLLALRRHLLRQGVQNHEIAVRGIADPGSGSGGNGRSGGDGPIIVSFESFTLKTFECNRRNEQSAYNPTNMSHPDFGCSLRSGLAAIIANPADIATPRPMQPADSMRRSRVHQNYRAGLATEAARGDNEAGGSIRTLGNN